MVWCKNVRHRGVVYEGSTLRFMRFSVPATSQGLELGSGHVPANRTWSNVQVLHGRLRRWRGRMRGDTDRTLSAWCDSAAKERTAASHALPRLGCSVGVALRVTSYVRVWGRRADHGSCSACMVTLSSDPVPSCNWVSPPPSVARYRGRRHCPLARAVPAAVARVHEASCVKKCFNLSVNMCSDTPRLTGIRI